MAVATLLDLNALAVELEELVQAELEISALRRELHDRLNSFSNELMQRREREVSGDRQAIHRRIDELQALFGHQY
jgi:hypothetical protein